MIYQGLFNILNIFFNDLDQFYGVVRDRFKIMVKDFCQQDEGKGESFPAGFQETIEYFTAKLEQFGFKHDEVEKSFTLEIMKYQECLTSDGFSRSECHEIILPIIYELFLEKIFNYIVDNNGTATAMVNFREKGLLPIEFMVKLNQLKTLFARSPVKFKRLQKYLSIKRKIINKFISGENGLKRLEAIYDPRDKLQFYYIIFRILEFFNLNYKINLKDVREFLKDNLDEWLATIPLVSLTNPDLYFCGIYLSQKLDAGIDLDYVKYYLLNLYDEYIEFEAPIMEATIPIYYFIMASLMVDLKLSDEQLRELLKGDIRYFEPSNLKSMETSHLVMILRIFKMLGIYKNIEFKKRKLILDEIEKRMGDDGVRQYREGFICSEAIYHAIFNHYMHGTLNHVHSEKLLDVVISRIYRNLELISFSCEINFDLITEILYSCETLKLLNCVEEKQFVALIVKYLFPDEVINHIENKKNIDAYLKGEKNKFRHVKICNITGEALI